MSIPPPPLRLPSYLKNVFSFLKSAMGLFILFKKKTFFKPISDKRD
jgi:hypothetical protein